MLPNYLRDDYEQLSDYQKLMFSQLVIWSNAGMDGFLVSASSYANILDIVKRMPREG
jgi:hypothetical protein